MDLAVHPCRTLCDWAPRGDVFACSGCGSEWLPSEPWTPRNRDGQVPPSVRSARDAAAAGTSGS